MCFDDVQIMFINILTFHFQKCNIKYKNVNLSKPTILAINDVIQNRQVFGLDRLNFQFVIFTG